jgi:hypothetical protein
MSTNFVVFNPGCANQESDATYASDATRTGGYATDQIVPSPLLNKATYQPSIGITALMQSLVAKGYSPNDGSAAPASALANLVAVLANIMTNADVLTAISLGNQAGYVKFGPAFGNLMVQWGVVSGVSSNVSNVVTYPQAFSGSGGSAPFNMLVPYFPAGVLGTITQWGVNSGASTPLTTFTFEVSSSTTATLNMGWFAIGKHS